MARKKEKVVEQTVKRTSYIRKVRQVEKVCPVCKKTFWGPANKRYDTRACQNKANYERHADDYRARRLEAYRKEKTSEPGPKPQKKAK